MSKDLNGIITSWNDSATRVFGYFPEEIIGSSILRLIPEHLHSDEKTIIENIRAGRRIEHFETVRRAKDGRLVDVSLTVSPIKDEDGRVIGASKILRDVSSRKRMEQSLLQAEKIAATGRMAATIAHEINNPLEAVMNLLYLLRAKITDDEGRPLSGARRKTKSDVCPISPSKRWGTIASTRRRAWRLSAILQCMRSPSTNRVVLQPASPSGDSSVLRQRRASPRRDDASDLQPDRELDLRNDRRWNSYCFRLRSSSAGEGIVLTD